MTHDFCGGHRYGDISPKTVPERAYAVILLFINIAITSYIIGIVTIILTKNDALKSRCNPFRC